MKLTLYSKPNCKYCDVVKTFIKDNNIQGIEYDESANVAEVRKFNGMQFPMLKITEDSGAEQAMFDSAMIVQVLEQLK